MKRAAFVLSLLVVLWVGALGVLAQDNPDYSGTYHLISIRVGNPPASALTVVHRERIKGSNFTQIPLVDASK
jgi:hypothetical protein